MFEAFAQTQQTLISVHLVERGGNAQEGDEARIACPPSLAREREHVTIFFGTIWLPRAIFRNCHTIRKFREKLKTETEEETRMYARDNYLVPPTQGHVLDTQML